MPGSTFTPYAGLSTGIGIVSYDLKVSGGGLTYKKDGTEAAFLIGPGGGVRYNLTDNLVLDGQVRYLFSTDYDIDCEDYKAPMLNFNVGLAYQF